MRLFDIFLHQGRLKKNEESEKKHVRYKNDPYIRCENSRRKKKGRKEQRIYLKT
jgi:hypothetical protein